MGTSAQAHSQAWPTLRMPESFPYRLRGALRGQRRDFKAAPAAVARALLLGASLQVAAPRLDLMRPRSGSDSLHTKSSLILKAKGLVELSRSPFHQTFWAHFARVIPRNDVKRPLWGIRCAPSEWLRPPLPDAFAACESSRQS